jgi:hypothetical protein
MQKKKCAKKRIYFNMFTVSYLKILLPQPAVITIVYYHTQLNMSRY